MSFELGLNIVEVDGRATPSIQPAATSVTGFVIRSQRGVVGDVVRVTNWSQFTERFGTYLSGAYGAYAVRGFFDNGGATAYITRVVNTEAGTATAAKISSTPGPWQTTPGGKLTFKTNLSATPVSATFNATSATLTGIVGPFNLADAGGGRTLTLTINGIERGPYQFLAGDFNSLSAATAGEVIAVLNREFPGIQALIEPTAKKLQVRTDLRGTGAALAGGGTAAGELGFTGATTGTGNVGNIDAVTPDEARTVIAGVLEPAPQGLIVTIEDQRLVITHPAPGASQTIQVIDDPAKTAGSFGFDTAVQTGTDGDPAQAAAAAELTVDSLTITAGHRGLIDQGTWGNDLRAGIAVNGTVFDLTIYRGDDDARVTLETYKGLSMNTAERKFVEAVVNDEVVGSKYVKVKTSSTTVPSKTEPTPLKGGRDGQFAPGKDTGTYVKAFDLFETTNIQLLCCPESSDQVVVIAGLAHAAKLRDRMFVGHTPFDNDMDAALKYGQGKGIQGSKVYGALYFPWIQINDPIGTRIWVPPTGHVLGVYARTERERGIWKAPAGNAALVQGALDVQYHITNRDHTSLVTEGSVNAVRYITGQGIVIDSSRTLSTNALWLYVNVRLLFNFVESSLMGGLRWTVQEPNSSELWNKVKFNSVTPFLLGLWRRGAFGPGTPEQVFTVKVDAENNSPADIQQGRLNIDVFFYPSRPAETIVITVGQQEGGATASES